MGFNWSSVGSIFSGITSALTSAGVSASTIPNIMAQIGLAANPNQSEEMNICAQIMIVAGNTDLVKALAQKLEIENGIPPAAAALAASLGQPGIDIPGRVLQIETIIKNGG